MRGIRLILLFILVNVSYFLQAQNNVGRPLMKKTPSASSMKAGAFIDVNTPQYPASNYTPEDLVKNVLISSGAACGTPNVSNVSVTPNLPASNQNRAWGYFHKGTTNFPFKDGIVLSTGFARKAGNDFVSATLGDDNTALGDADLSAAMGLPGTYTNAAVLEFDFVPTSTQIKFNYLLASEEYSGSYPCSFADGFALLLRPAAGGPYVNMAVLPGGAGPVSVTNIHPANSNTGGNLSCGAANAQYFDSYNTADIETNFEGRTIPLTATATVVPGQAYHFKMVVADYSSLSFPDRIYDTAVFLEGGSFDIGVKLLDANGVELPTDINVCDNTPTLLTASVDIPGATYKWFRNGVLIPGATTNNYTAVLPGNYKIEVWVPGNNCPGTAEITVHGGITPIAQNASYLLCATPGNQTFNLQQLTPLITTTPGAQLKFYINQADAIARNNNFITNVYDFNSTGQTLYVDVSDGGFCYRTIELVLDKEQTPVAGLTSSRVRICEGESIKLTATGGATYEWVNFSGNTDTQNVTLTHTTTFEVYAIGPKGCRSTLPAKITVEVLPKLTTNLQGAEICDGDSTVLDPGIVGNYNYLWSNGDTTPTTTVNEWGIYTLIIDNGLCTQNFEFKVQAAPLPVITGIDYNNTVLSVNALNPTPLKPLEYSLDGITWQDSNTFNNVLNNITVTIRVRNKGTSCETSIDFFTAHISNLITPNGDGFNDVIDLTGFTKFDNFKSAIYDRYGSPIFEFSKFRPVWDGTIQGKRLNTGTYWYELNWTYPKSDIPVKRSGWIMLKNRE